MPPPMQGQRNAASPGSAHLWQPGQTISNGVLDAHGRRGRVVLLQSFLVGELHVIEGHQASDKASFHVIHRNQSKLGIPLQRIQWRHWATVVHLAMGRFPVQSFRCDNSFSSVGMQTRRQVSTFHLQCLLVIILPEGEATQPLRSAKEITELRTHRLRILDSFGQSSIRVSGRSQDQLVVEDDSALAVGIGQSQPQSEAPLCAFGRVHLVTRGDDPYLNSSQPVYILTREHACACVRLCKRAPRLARSCFLAFDTRIDEPTDRYRSSRRRCQAPAGPPPQRPSSTSAAVLVL